MELKKYVATVLCVMLWYGYGEASSIQIPQSTLYNYKTTIVLQDDFLTGATASGQIGSLGFSSSGTLAVSSPSLNRLGILNLSTSAVVSTLARVSGFGTNNIVYGNLVYLLWIVKLISNDANTQVRIGIQSNWTLNPSTDGVYFEKLDADTNWFTVTRVSGVQTRTDTGILIDSNYHVFKIVTIANRVDFYIDGVLVTSHTTNIPAGSTALNFGLNIINSAAVSKSIDVDYFETMISVVR